MITNMPDICIFYSEPDENKVEALSLILENFGCSVGVFGGTKILRVDVGG